MKESVRQAHEILVLRPNIKIPVFNVTQPPNKIYSWKLDFFQVFLEKT